MDPYLLLVYLVSAFTIAALFFPVLIKLLSEMKVLDAPRKDKIHRHDVPSMGGICILLGACFGLVIGLPLSEWGSLKFFFISLALIFITGLRDDILTLTPHEKLVGQILPIILLVVFGDTMLKSFYGAMLPGFVFPMPLAWLLTAFTIIILTNACNLIDGIDGLAGAVAALALTCFGIWFYFVGYFGLALIALSFMGATLAFLLFNWEPARIFMGDTGALVIGLVLSFLAVKFINLNFALPDIHPMKFRSSVGTAICVLIMPIFDTLRVILLRVSRRQSPFRADHNHLHHVLLTIGFSHAGAVYILLGINLIFVSAAVILRNQGDAAVLSVAAIGCFITNLAFRNARKKFALPAGDGGVEK